ncbi:MAG: hypothetical protein Q4A29_01150 [Eubacteriales bacterium]|nr:hypothetical protein [Eubacteriales bacterium]
MKKQIILTRLENSWKAWRKKEGLRLVFEPGEYHFYPDYAFEKLLYVPNHDEDTIKRVAFSLEGFQNLQIEGQDTTFLFHTDIIPFHIKECENVEIRGITIDYAVPGYSEGRVVEAAADKLLLGIDSSLYSYKVEDGDIFFRGENFEYGIWH